MEYTLIRSNRKTLALYIRRGGLEVRAPLHLPKRDIDKFVISKEKWIREKLAESGEKLARRESFALAYEDSVTYRGRQYPIAAKKGDSVGFNDEQFYMPPGLDSEQIKGACIQIYRLLAKRDLTNKTIDFAKQMSAKPAAVKINSAKTRWGSCSTIRNLNFSWRLIMADDDLIDYVVVHELAHLAEMNHSARFWAIVEGVLPDFRERKARLRELQRSLSFEDW